MDAKHTWIKKSDSMKFWRCNNFGLWFSTDSWAHVDVL